jgi:hypothetical protein
MELDEETRDDLLEDEGEPSELEELIQPDLGSGELEPDPAPRHQDDDDQWSARVKKRIDKEVGRRKALEERFADRERALLDQINTLSAEVGAIKTRNAAADAQAAEGTLQAKLHSAKQRLRQAMSDGDDDAAVTATEDIADARVEMREMAARQERQREQQEQQGRQQQTDNQQPQIPETMGKWLKANSWYQSGQNPRAARLAAELFEDIRQDGFDPNDTSTYAELNKRIRAAIPRAADTIKDIESAAPTRRREVGPPTGTSSADGRAAPVSGARRTFTDQDKARMRAFDIEDTPENRKIWLANHP